MRFSYNPAQVSLAAAFLWKNNPSCPAWPDAPKSKEDVEHIIMGYVRRQALKCAQDVYKTERDEWSYVSTGGFTVQLWEEGLDYFGIEVLVDPAIGAEHSFEYLTRDIPTTDW